MMPMMEVKGEEQMTMTPYAKATSNMRAREETRKLLLHFGCQSVGFMDDASRGDVLLAFEHRGQNVQIRVSAKGWAAEWLRKNPYGIRHRCTRHEWEQKALAQGLIAVNSIIRDWIKGQITAIETGMLAFEVAFMPHMLTQDGRTMAERIAELKLLPAPEAPKVVQLSGAA
jgi:hypothetical protein